MVAVSEQYTFHSLKENLINEQLLNAWVWFSSNNSYPADFLLFFTPKWNVNFLGGFPPAYSALY